jgi:hypothetical protein
MQDLVIPGWVLEGVLCAVGVVLAILLALLVTESVSAGGLGPGLWRTVLFVGRTRLALVLPCSRACKRFVDPPTCQIPMFHSLSDVYRFLWGYSEVGTFVEVGGFDGQSFSNTCTLADVGWEGHYVEPIPEFAAQCKARHISNEGVKVSFPVETERVRVCELPLTQVHTFAVCGKEGEGTMLELTPAGPFSSGVEDEVAAVRTGSLSSVVEFLGWKPSSSTVSATALSLDTIMRSHVRLTPASSKKPPVAKGTWSHAAFATPPEGYALNLLVIDVEGLEWPILRDFDIDKWRPQVAIVEIQEKLSRFQASDRALVDAMHLEKWFWDHGYSILFRDAINTVFVHRGFRCHGEEN